MLTKENNFIKSIKYFCRENVILQRIWIFHKYYRRANSELKYETLIKNYNSCSTEHL